jgi:hypothetical protein
MLKLNVYLQLCGTTELILLRKCQNKALPKFCILTAIVLFGAEYCISMKEQMKNMEYQKEFF